MIYETILEPRVWSLFCSFSKWLRLGHHYFMEVNLQFIHNKIFIKASFKKGGGGGYIVDLVFRHSVRHSVCHNLVSAQYLENTLIEFNQILKMH